MKRQTHLKLKRTLIIILIAVGLFVAVSAFLMWRFAIHETKKPEVVGVTFSPVRARRFNLNWQETYLALLDDLRARHLRLVAYWDRLEPEKNRYDFSETDWQISEAKKRGAKVTLTIGQKVLGYPECFYPGWLDRNNPEEVSYRARQMIAAVINHYKDEPMIEAWQLENEFRLKSFGVCPRQNLTNRALKKELATLKSIDSTRPVVISQSDEWGFPILGPVGDIYALSMYKWVWANSPIYRGYFHYPQPGAYDWWKAAVIYAYTGQDIVVHELQAEAWGPQGNEVLPVEEAYKSMNPQKLQDNINYARATKIKRFDLWGAEWWYYLKVKLGRPEMWERVRQILKTSS